MKSLKAEFKEQFIFQEKHIGLLCIVVLFGLMIPLVIPDLFLDEPFSKSVHSSSSLDNLSLVALVFGMFATIIQSSVVLVSFGSACATRFGTAPYSKLKRAAVLLQIVRRLMGQFTTEELFSAASKLPKSKTPNTISHKALAEKDRKINDLEKKVKELEKKLSDKDRQ